MGWPWKTDKKPEEVWSLLQEHNQAATIPSVAKLKAATQKAGTSAKSEKSQQSSHSEEVCEDTDHGSASDELKRSAKAEKLRESNNAKRGSPSHESQERVRQDTRVKSNHLKTSPSSSGTGKSQDSKNTEDQCLNTDRKTAATSDVIGAQKPHLNLENHQSRESITDPKKPKTPTKSKKARKLRDSANEEGCQDDDHVDPLSVDSEKSKARRSKTGEKTKGLKRGGNASASPECPEPVYGSSVDPKKLETSKESKQSKKSKKKDRSTQSEAGCQATDHQSSSLEVKKSKSTKSLKTKAKKSKESRKSKKAESANECLCPQEHKLSECDVQQTNDGASSRKTSRSVGENSSQTSAQAFPRGLQIMAKHTDTLEGGFPYPKELATFGITKDNWTGFCSALMEPLANKKIAYAVETMLDTCAEYDLAFFRPKGFIMRLDMPGEEKYGLDLMDIYHPQVGSKHTDNLTAIPPPSTEHAGAIKHKHHIRERTNDRKHLESLRQKAFRSTRLMLDPIVVLKDPELVAQRGWGKWILACNEAHKLAEEAPPVRMDNRPWYGYFPARWDRWPPSKHLYYDRFRGSSHIVGRTRSLSTFFVPDCDSMDQRGTPSISPVIPCDEVGFVVLKPTRPYIRL